ncbi:hypothetical protein GDO86_006017 [Hymenochirus boettgeri]|uniref:Uncharacterized protein n=1 Tax=Hymenochirus boettgeri TaxID=247094 RepID=A0A8T2J9T6_9PIPI|nr:hypothetical protein GDO86_006017 [Hymenochirus boettgeri]
MCTLAAIDLAGHWALGGSGDTQGREGEVSARGIGGGRSSDTSNTWTRKKHPPAAAHWESAPLFPYPGRITGTGTGTRSLPDRLH